MDSEPTTLFNSYEQDFQHILHSIRERLDGAGKDQRGEQGKASLRKVEMELDEADEMVSQMEIEIQGIPQSIKPPYQARLKSAKSDLTRFKKLSKDLHAQLSRSNLLARSGISSHSDEPYEHSDRARLLAGTAKLSDGSRRLQDSERLALETEVEGADILRNLREQREQIENARDTLRTADVSIDRATGTLKKMIWQMYRQRVIFAVIAVVFVVIIAIILWAKLFRR